MSEESKQLESESKPAAKVEKIIGIDVTEYISDFITDIESITALQCTVDNEPIKQDGEGVYIFMPSLKMPDNGDIIAPMRGI